MTTTLTANTDYLVKIARARELAASGAAQAIREAAGISRSEMAEVCGVSEVTVWRWEASGPRGRRPRGLPAARYADALDALMNRNRRGRSR